MADYGQQAAPKKCCNAVPDVVLLRHEASTVLASQLLDHYESTLLKTQIAATQATDLVGYSMFVGAGGQWIVGVTCDKSNRLLLKKWTRPALLLRTQICKFYENLC